MQNTAYSYRLRASLALELIGVHSLECSPLRATLGIDGLIRSRLLNILQKDTHCQCNKCLHSPEMATLSKGNLKYDWCRGVVVSRQRNSPQGVLTRRGQSFPAELRRAPSDCNVAPDSTASRQFPASNIAPWADPTPGVESGPRSDQHRIIAGDRLHAQTECQRLCRSYRIPMISGKHYLQPDPKQHLAWTSSPSAVPVE